MKRQIKFIRYGGEEIKLNRDVLQKMREAEKSREEIEGSCLDYIGETSNIICMFEGDELLGFAWTEYYIPESVAELCWIVTNKEKIKSLDAKLLLDNAIEECKKDGIEVVNFNCYERSWGRIKDKEKLFEGYGYKVREEEYYDVSIDIN